MSNQRSFTSDSESISEVSSYCIAGLAARGRTVDDCDTVERRDIRELIDNVRRRNGRLGSPSSSKSSSWSTKWFLTIIFFLVFYIYDIKGFKHMLEILYAPYNAEHDSCSYISNSCSYISNQQWKIFKLRFSSPCRYTNLAYMHNYMNFLLKFFLKLVEWSACFE